MTGRSVLGGVLENQLLSSHRARVGGGAVVNGNRKERKWYDTGRMGKLSPQNRKSLWKRDWQGCLQHLALAFSELIKASLPSLLGDVP